MELVITKDNAERIRVPLIIEAANGNLGTNKPSINLIMSIKSFLS